MKGLYTFLAYITTKSRWQSTPADVKMYECGMQDVAAIINN